MIKKNNLNVNIFVPSLILLLCVLLTPKHLSATEVMIDVDAFDNLAVADRYGIDYYGPEQIAELFANCKASGVDIVFWRCTSQIASYKSKLNYNCGQADSIRSRPDSRFHSGVFAAKVGLIDRAGGLYQEIQDIPNGKYIFSAWVSFPDESTISLVVEDCSTGKVIAESSEIKDSEGAFKRIEIKFTTTSPVRIGVVGDARKTFYNFVVDDVSVLDADGKEYIKNGSMESVSRLVPIDWDASSSNYLVLNGDILKLDAKSRQEHFPNIEQFIRLQKHYNTTNANSVKALSKYDPLEVAVSEAHKNNIKIYGWMDPLDDGRRFAPSFGVYWVSMFMEENPECRLVDKYGNRRWGQLCFGYKKVQDYKVAVINEILDYGVDGIYLKTAHQHNQVWDGNTYQYDQFVYNDIALEKYAQKWGKPESQEYDIERLKDIHGGFFYDCIAEISKAVHNRGKQLCLSMEPAQTIGVKNGSWPLDWKKLVESNIIDELLIEPRHGGGHKGYIDSLDNAFNYVNICRRNDVKFGFDFYLNALAEKRVYGDLAKTNPKEYLTNELVEIAKSPVDYVGIYEGMYVDLYNYWPAIKEAVEKIGEITDSRRTRTSDRKRVQQDDMINWALVSNGAKARLTTKDGGFPATQVIDGQLSNTNPLTVESAPFTVQIDLPGLKRIDTVRLYTGTTNNAYNPSGECGIKSYRIEGLNKQGEWVLVAAPVINALSFIESGSITEYDFKYEHNIGNIGEISAVRIIVEEAGDTGLRLSCRNVPCIPIEQRISNLREIQLFGSDK